MANPIETSAANRLMSHGLRVGSKVWIAAVWDHTKKPREVTITSIWNRYNFHFKPKVFGESFFGPNGKCFGAYHWAYKTKEEAEAAR